MTVAMTMLDTELPSAAAMPTASTKSGKAMIVSRRRLTMRSVQPPAQPATAPSAVPRMSVAATAVSAMPRSTRAATTTRLNTSRPSWSVPKRWRGRGWLQRRRRVGGERIVGHDPRPEHRQHQEHGEEEPGEGVAFAPTASEGPAPARAQPSKRTFGSRGQPEAMSMARLSR